MQTMAAENRIEAHFLWMSYLSPGQLKQIQLVCKEWQKLVTDDRIWQQVCQRSGLAEAALWTQSSSLHDFYHHPMTQLYLQQVGGIEATRIRTRLKYQVDGSKKVLVTRRAGEVRVIAVDVSGSVVSLSPFRSERTELVPPVQGSPVTALRVFQLRGETCLAVARENRGITVTSLGGPKSLFRGSCCNFWTRGSIKDLCVLEEENGSAMLVFDEDHQVVGWRVPGVWEVAEPKVSVRASLVREVVALHRIECCNNVLISDGHQMLHWAPLVAGFVCAFSGSTGIDDFQTVSINDRLHLLGSDGNQIEHWNLSNMHIGMPFHSHAPNKLTAWLAVGGSESGRLYGASEDGSLLQWSISPASLMGTAPGNGSVIRAMLLMTIGARRLLVTGSSDGRVTFREAMSGNLCSSLQASGPVKQLISIPTQYGPVYLGIIDEEGTLEIRDFLPVADSVAGA